MAWLWRLLACLALTSLVAACGDDPVRSDGAFSDQTSALAASQTSKPLADLAPFDWDRVVEVDGCETGRCINEAVGFRVIRDDWDYGDSGLEVLVFVKGRDPVRLLNVVGGRLVTAHPGRAWPRTVWLIAEPDCCGGHLILGDPPASSGNPE